jgi:peptidoglycan/LPS O-acetylase OafA/YrhL
VFFMVCAGVVARRLCASGEDGRRRPVTAALAVVTAGSAGVSMSFKFGAPWPAMAAFAAVWLAGTSILALAPHKYSPTRFTVPWFPFTPCLGIFFNVHLMCSLGWPAYVRFAVWVAIGLAIYTLYGVHAVEERELDIGGGGPEVQMGLTGETVQLLRAKGRERQDGGSGAVPSESGSASMPKMRPSLGK